jgi:hypothetical protein
VSGTDGGDERADVWLGVGEVGRSLTLVAPTCVRCIVSVALVGVSAGGSIEGEQHKRGTVLGDVSKWRVTVL